MKKSFIAFVIVSIFVSIIACANPVVFAEESFVQNDYDYSRERDISYNSVDVVGVLENLFGENLSEIEKKYLLQNSRLSLNYSDTISISNVTTEYDGNRLLVSAVPYSYKSVNARGVSWLPSSVNGKEFEKIDDKYTVVFDELDENFGDSVSVKYEALLQLNYKDINKYINYVFDLGRMASEKLEQKRAEYEEAERIYQEHLQKYNEYLDAYSTYLDDYEVYQAYLVEYSLWQDKVNAYSRYLSEYEAYRKEIVLYEEYLKELQQYNKEYQAYREYLSLLEAYNKELAIYNEQTSSTEAQTTIYQLSILHYLTTPVTSLNRTIYSAIMGSAVTQVLAEKEALVTVGKVEGRAVDLAASATESLRRLLEQYNKYTNDDDRYVFYILCQEELSKNFNDLFRALDFMYNEYPIVQKVINQMEKKEQFEILLAQLYCMCNALSNDPVPNYIMVYKGKNASGAGYFDANYRIGDSKKTVRSILGVDGILEDKNNATPLENGVPNLPQPPIKPTEVKAPKAPKKVNEPIKPDTVERPGEAPKKVSMPTVPEKVDEPIAPEEYEPTAEELELSHAYEFGDLKQRELYQSNVFYRAETTVQKFFRNVKIATLYFYDGQSTNNLLCSIPEVQLGSYVEYPLSEYPKMTKRGYTCTFDGWVDESGNMVDLNRFNVDKSDVYLYPHFKETPNNYRVFWQIDSKTKYEDECAFGEKPIFDTAKFGEISRDKNGIREYRFIGWKKGDKFYQSGTELETMYDMAVTYEAVFEASYIVTFKVSESEVGTSYSYWFGEIPQFEGVPTKKMDSKYVYSFSDWDSPLVAVDKDKTYVAKFESTPLVEIKTLTSVNGGTVAFKDNLFVADCQSSVSSNYGVKILFGVAKQYGKGVKLELAGANVSFSPTAVNDLAENGVDRMYIYFANTSKFKYRYIIKAFDEDGNEICTGNTIIEVDAYGLFDEENSFLYETTLDGEVRDVRFSVLNNRIYFSARLGSSYRIEAQHNLGAIPSEFVEITLSTLRATSGETISISLSEPPKGMYVESIYIVADDETEVILGEDKTFKMPACAVSVGVVCAYYEYTVTFKSEGKIISIRTYKYGEKVVEPAATYKASDDKYSYDFVGWDSEVKNVDGDAVYTAVYKSKPLVKESIIPETTRLTKLLHLAYIVIPVATVILIGFIVLITCLAVKRHKRRKAKRANVK